MELIWKKAGAFLFYLFSAWCIVACIGLYRIERSAAEPKEPEAEIPAQDIVETEMDVNTYAASLEDILSQTEENLREKQEDINRYRERYAVLAMLEEKENQVAREVCPDRMYEKYFRLREGELARIAGADDTEQVGWQGMLNSHFSAVAFEIHRDMWVQYSGSLEYIEEYGTPSGILIMNPEVDLGYMDARAGMNFEEIQENAVVGAIQTGFMYTSDHEIYYLEYEADGYRYRYLSEYLDGTDSWLVITNSALAIENIENQPISFEDFGEMDYALFLETAFINDGGEYSYAKYGIFGDFISTVEEGEKRET